MDKTFRVLLWLAGGLIVLNGCLLVYNPKVKVPEKLGSIVRLVTAEGRTFCSGTVISDHIILTAAHCIMEETPWGTGLRANIIGIRVDDNIERGIVAFPLAASPQMDQARLTGDFRAFKHAPYIGDIARLVHMAQKNTKFTACGYPMGGHLYCNTLYYDDIAVFMWAMRGVLIPGMSGGPTMLGDTVVATNCAMDNNRAIVSPIYNVDDELDKRK